MKILGQLILIHYVCAELSPYPVPGYRTIQPEPQKNYGPPKKFLPPIPMREFSNKDIQTYFLPAQEIDLSPPSTSYGVPNINQNDIESLQIQYLPKFNSGKFRDISSQHFNQNLERYRLQKEAALIDGKNKFPNIYQQFLPSRESQNFNKGSRNNEVRDSYLPPSRNDKNSVNTNFNSNKNTEANVDSQFHQTLPPKNVGYSYLPPKNGLSVNTNFNSNRNVQSNVESQFNQNVLPQNLGNRYLPPKSGGGLVNTNANSNKNIETNVQNQFSQYLPPNTGDYNLNTNLNTNKNVQSNVESQFNQNIPAENAYLPPKIGGNNLNTNFNINTNVQSNAESQFNQNIPTENAYLPPNTGGTNLNTNINTNKNVQSNVESQFNQNIPAENAYLPPNTGGTNLNTNLNTNRNVQSTVDSQFNQNLPAENAYLPPKKGVINLSTNFNTKSTEETNVQIKVDQYLPPKNLQPENTDDSQIEERVQNKPSKTNRYVPPQGLNFNSNAANSNVDIKRNEEHVLYLPPLETTTPFNGYLPPPTSTTQRSIRKKRPTRKPVTTTTEAAVDDEEEEIEEEVNRGPNIAIANAFAGFYSPQDPQIVNIPAQKLKKQANLEVLAPMAQENQQLLTYQIQNYQNYQTPLYLIPVGK